MDAITAMPSDIIHKLRPRAKSVKSREEGVINSVFLVDDEVFRFPREAGGRQILLYEAEILSRLTGKMSLNISALKEVAVDGSYIILSFVPGRMLGSEDIMAFSPQQKKSLAKTIVECIRAINAALSTEEIEQFVKKYIPWQKPEDEFYQSILNSNIKSKYHSLYVACFENYVKRQNAVGKPQDIVVYGDFHYGNMLFSGAGELVGLIDFGDVNVGNIVTECRQIYRLGADIVEYMIAELGDEFGPVDLELIKLHAIIHEVWVLMRTEGKQPPKDGRDKLARQLLSQWLGPNWSDL